MDIDARKLIRLVPVLLLAAAGLILVARHSGDDGGPDGSGPSAVEDGERWAGSTSCQSCHPSEHAAWESSHHALAEKVFEPGREGKTFRGPDGGAREVRAGEARYVLRSRDGRAEVAAHLSDGTVRRHEPVRVIGVEPLWQNVISVGGGRYQVTALAYDPERDEWFDATADQAWKPHEWGHWTQRGMNWNSMCAPCHVTNYRKGYDVANDAYNSSWLEAGVGCESCHGPSAAHVEAMRAAGRTEPPAPGPDRWSPERFLGVEPEELPPDDELFASAAASRLPELPPGAEAPGREAGSESETGGEVDRGEAAGAPPQETPGPATPPAIDTDRVVDTCGACHARRADITGRFRAGDLFLDHFRPDIPDATAIFWPDGQVREEDYEYASFLSSRMYLVGVRCLHCHEPHSGELRAEGNELCMRCHRGKIDPAAHAHHEPGTPGGRCVDCHMPRKVFMQRDVRHDHGFTIPDPVLTRDHGIPNACGDCHEDRGVDWAVGAVERWYGERMDRWTRRRARLIARGRAGDPSSARGLLDLSREDPNPLWRASAVSLLSAFAADRSAVAERLLEGLESPSALVRAYAARALEPWVAGGLGAFSAERAGRMLRALVDGLEDPVRLVRVEAAWALRAVPDPEAPPARPGTRPARFLVGPGRKAHRDLERYLDLAADQPSGRHQRGTLHFDRGRVERAIPWLRKAVEWSPTAAGNRHDLAVALSAAGRSQAALEHIEEACRLEPENPVLAHALGRAYAEVGRYEDAEEALELACQLAPRDARAWYNLAHARWQLEKTDEALDTIIRAEELAPDDPDVLATRAALHRELGQDALADDYEERARRVRQELARPRRR